MPEHSDLREVIVNALSKSEGEEPDMIEARYGEQLDVIQSIGLLWLEPSEVVRLVQLFNFIPEHAMTMNEDNQMSLFEEDPFVVSLAQKVSKLSERDDVKAYIDRHFK